MSIESEPRIHRRASLTDLAILVVAIFVCGIAVPISVSQAAPADEKAKDAPTTKATQTMTSTTSAPAMQLPPTGELHGKAYVAAIKARDAADLARSAYEKQYTLYEWRNRPLPPEADEAFAKVETLYRDAIDKAGMTDIGVYTRQRLAGAYQYRGQKERAAAMNKEAEELKLAVEQLKEQHRLRREGADWPELAAMIRLLHLPSGSNVTPEELAEAWKTLGARSDEAVGRLMEEFWLSVDYAYRWRTITALGKLNSARSRQALLELALRAEKDDLPWVRGAAQQYVSTLTDKSEARRLLASNDIVVLQQAAMGLRGAVIDKEIIGRVLELTKSLDPDLRRLVVGVLGNDPSGQFAPEKVAAIVQAIPAIATMDKADAVAWPGSWTKAEVHYREYIGALAGMANAAKPIADEIVRAKAGETAWRCLVLARALGGDAKARPELLRILQDSDAGLFRAWAAQALVEIATSDDLALLREVAEKDPMQREQGGCIAPQNKQLYYPVRQAAQQAIKALQAGSVAPDKQPKSRPAAPLAR